jgi:hypothetical protein
MSRNSDAVRGGYSVHALRAVYLREKWHRIDARGNKDGVCACDVNNYGVAHETVTFPLKAT